MLRSQLKCCENERYKHDSTLASGKVEGATRILNRSDGDRATQDRMTPIALAFSVGGAMTSVSFPLEAHELYHGRQLTYQSHARG